MSTSHRPWPGPSTQHPYRYPPPRHPFNGAPPPRVPEPRQPGGQPPYASPSYPGYSYPGQAYPWRAYPEPAYRPGGTRRPRVPRSITLLLARLVVLVLALDLAAEAYFVSLNWRDPPATAYMLEEQYFGDGEEFLHDYVDLAYVSRYMTAATLAHEDSQLPVRFSGLDWEQLIDRAESYHSGQDDPYGSPIPEQLSKNLLLFPARNSLRKAMDAVLAEQLVHAMPRTRVLELYLNVAQFGPGLYGVCDAAWYYFGEPPDHMSWDDAYQLMGLLPGPSNARRAAAGGIDTDPNTPEGKYTLGKINGARTYVPRELDASGGNDRDRLALVKQMGIAGSASTQPDGPGSCRTMPDGVRERIKQER